MIVYVLISLRSINKVQFHEYECHLSMDASILSHGVAYKYCVADSPLTFEYLHGFEALKSGHRNRYLKIEQTGMM